MVFNTDEELWAFIFSPPRTVPYCAVMGFDFYRLQAFPCKCVHLYMHCMFAYQLPLPCYGNECFVYQDTVCNLRCENRSYLEKERIAELYRNMKMVIGVEVSWLKWHHWWIITLGWMFTLVITLPLIAALQTAEIGPLQSRERFLQPWGKVSPGYR